MNTTFFIWSIMNGFLAGCVFIIATLISNQTISDPLSILDPNTVSDPKIDSTSQMQFSHDNVQALVATGTIRSLTDSLQWVSQYCEGQLVDAQLFQENDQLRYLLQFKLVNEDVISLQLDAVSGMLESLDQLPSECNKHETATR